MFENRYLTRWQEAGLIDADTVERIRLHEAQEQRPLWLWAVSGLGCLAIATGIVSVVAANWDHIPANLKLGIDFLLLAALAGGLLAADAKGCPRVRDILAFLLFGLVLASIALISQVYQLDGKIWVALATWVAICTPFLLLGTDSRLLAAAWALAVGAAMITGWSDILSPLKRWMPAEPKVLPLLLLTAILLFAALCLDPWVRRRAQAGTLRQLALLALLAAGSAPQIQLAAPSGRHELNWAEPLFGLVLVGIAIAAMLLRRRQLGGLLMPILALMVGAALGWLVSVGLARLGAGGMREGPSDSNMVSLLLAAPFIAFWALAGWLALRGGRRLLFIIAFAVIAVRILIFYWQAFGGLLNTGLGLIAGGVICLALAAAGRWLFRRFPGRISGQAA